MERPHAVIIPFPSSGHINPHLKLAMLLHSKGFYITFVNTEFSHQCILKSRGLDTPLEGSDDFRFETFPDGLLPSDRESPEHWNRMYISLRKNGSGSFRELLMKLNNSPGVPPVTCIIPNGLMSFTMDVSNKLAIPSVVFWTTSACGFMGYLHLDVLIQKGLIPLKDESYLTNGYLDTTIDWIPGMKGIRLGDLASFVRITDPDDINLHYDKEEANNSFKAQGIIFNTIESMEREVLNALKAMFPQVYTIGPLPTFTNLMEDNQWKSMRLSVYKEEAGCKKWLNSQKTASVVYVSFGSIIVTNAQQLGEFAWGLAESNHPFLLVIRPDMVPGGHNALSKEFMMETKGRCFIASWCNQEEVLSHDSIGGFLTHNGWNSTMESVCNGVPMISHPGFAEQYTNCRFVSKVWGIGMEIGEEVKREEVMGVVRELMGGDKGKVIKKNVMEWKEKAEKATRQGGSSYGDMDRLVNDLTLNKMPRYPLFNV